MSSISSRMPTRITVANYGQGSEVVSNTSRGKYNRRRSVLNRDIPQVNAIEMQRAAAVFNQAAGSDELRRIRRRKPNVAHVA